MCLPQLRLTLRVDEGLVNKFCSLTEVLRNVKSGFVISFNTQVPNVHASVVICTSQHVVPLSYCRIEDMCNSQILQSRPLQSCFPVCTLNTHSACTQTSNTSAHMPEQRSNLSSLTRRQGKFSATPGWRVHTELWVQTRKAAPSLEFLVWCSHCPGPPVPLRTDSCLWTFPHRRTCFSYFSQRIHIQPMIKCVVLCNCSLFIWKKSRMVLDLKKIGPLFSK